MIFYAWIDKSLWFYDDFLETHVIPMFFMLWWYDVKKRGYETKHVHMDFV